MLDLVKKYLKVKAEAKRLMGIGDLDGYMNSLREMYELRNLIPQTQQVK